MAGRAAGARAQKPTFHFNNSGPFTPNGDACVYAFVGPLGAHITPFSPSRTGLGVRRIRSGLP